MKRAKQTRLRQGSFATKWTTPDDVTFHPDRRLTPLKRSGNKGAGKFERISWDQAMSEIATKLKATIYKEGPQSVLPYSYAGTEGLIQREAISSRFFARIGATKLERTICGDPAVAGVMATNGDTTGVLPEDIIHNRYIILWGTNPVVSNQHLWPFILKAKQNGARIVVIVHSNLQPRILRTGTFNRCQEVLRGSRKTSSRKAF